MTGLKPLLTYRCGYGPRGNGCLLGHVVVVDGITQLAKPDLTTQIVPTVHRGPVDKLFHLKCKHLDVDLHPSVVRHDMTVARSSRVVIVRPHD